MQAKHSAAAPIHGASRECPNTLNSSSVLVGARAYPLVVSAENFFHCSATSDS